jgi:hypothetical protein
MTIFSDYYRKDLTVFLKRFVPSNNYIILANTFVYLNDIQDYIRKLKVKCRRDTRIVVIYFNYLWKPILDFATFLGLIEKERKEPNWLTPDDISNLFRLEGFDKIKEGKRFLFPFDLGEISKLVNNFIGQLPILNNLCLTIFQVFRQVPMTSKYSTSIIIPARNEEGNISGILSKIPKLGRSTEVIFVEGHSKDNTWKAILKEIKRNAKVRLDASVYKQKGKGKADAVKLGFRKAKNDILMILDADLTVSPKDLKKFYNALASGVCDFANGSRLVYPLEKDSMKLLNFLGNSLFSTLFTYLIGQHIKDTLCGTKALFRKDYKRIVANQKEFGNFDPFGDFNLLFGATKLNLKICDIPVRYSERVYGKTNISRFVHGWLLIKMTLIAAKKIKFI